MSPLKLVILGVLSGIPLLSLASEKATWTLEPVGGEGISIEQFTGAEQITPRLQAVARWAGWNGEHLQCESDSSRIRIATVRSEEGYTVALWNASDEKTEVALKGELPMGIYTVDRLVMSAKSQDVFIERRNGLPLVRRGSTQRTEWLNPHSGIILRFVERVQPADRSARALRQVIWQSGARGTAISRIAALMREASNHWYSARARLRQGATVQAARDIHRMLFLISGVKAVAANYSGLQEVSQRADTLIDALSELSSAMLSVTATVNHEEQGLNVRVVNAGAVTWKALRIAPEAVEHHEAIVLANVKPMEQARVLLKMAEQQAVPAVVLSVLFNGGYARIKVPCSPVKWSEPKEERAE